MAGSIPDEVTGFFNWPKPSSLTVSLVLTQPLTELDTTNLPGVKGRPASKISNFATVCKPLVHRLWEPRRLTNLWPPWPVATIILYIYMYTASVV
jgi:hypothetical protein